MGKIISFDPNYRSQLWKSEDHAKEMIKKGLLNSDIVKLSEEEYHLLMGEMEFPTQGWRGAMTLPRELFFTSKGLLIQKPIKELENLRDEHIQIKIQMLAPDKDLLSNLQGTTWGIIAEFEFEEANEFGIKVCKSTIKETLIGYNVDKEEIYIDRRISGETSFNEFFSSLDCVAVKAQNNRIKFHVYLDRSTIEVFGNNGEIAMTNLIFPDSQSHGLELFSNGGNVKLLSLDMYRLKSIWSS